MDADLAFVLGGFTGIGIGFLAAALLRRDHDAEAFDSAPVADAPTDVPSDQFPVLDPYAGYSTLSHSTDIGKGL